jgi:hypothetical protein
MREKKYNNETGQYEWVDVGQASAGGYGTGDMHRIVLRNRNAVEAVVSKTENMSKTATKRYLRGVKLRQYNVENLNELRNKSEYTTKPCRTNSTKDKMDKYERTYKEKYLGISSKKISKFDKYTN